MKTIISLVILLGAGCTGMVDEGQGVCELAASHLAACTGQTAPAAGACDASAASEANTLLGMDCGAIRALGTGDGRSTTSSKQPCLDPDARTCVDTCVELFEAYGMRLKSTSCKVIDGQVNCQCKGYWWFW